MFGIGLRRLLNVFLFLMCLIEIVLIFLGERNVNLIFFILEVIGVVIFMVMLMFELLDLEVGDGCY